jgi:hypothetical protein
MKKIFSNIFVLLVGTCFAVIIGENLAGYYLRKLPLGREIAYFDSKSVSSPRYQKLSFRQFDQELGFSLRPGAEDVLVTSDFTVTYSINSQGMRDKEVPLKKPGKEFRILALGESTVFGEGINYGNRFTEVIEEVLPGVEIINLGVDGFGLDQSFLQLKREGFKFNPNAGIVFIFAPDYLDRCMDITGSGTLTVKPRFILRDDKNGLVLQDIGYNRKELKTEIFPFGNNILGASGQVDKKHSTQSNKLITSHSSLLKLLNYYTLKQKVKMEIRAGDMQHFHNIREIISWQEKRRQSYKADDFNKLIFILMKEYQKAFREHNVDFTVANISSTKLEFVERTCKELDISYLDLSEIIMRASQSEQMQFPINRHYNDRYHRMVGEYVSNYLNKKYNLKARSGYNYQYLGKFNYGSK